MGKRRGEGKLLVARLVLRKSRLRMRKGGLGWMGIDDGLRKHK